MRDSDDNLTAKLPDLGGVKRGRGRPKKLATVSGKERTRAYRARKSREITEAIGQEADAPTAALLQLLKNYCHSYENLSTDESHEYAQLGIKRILAVLNQRFAPKNT
jgi:hypothetical protein